jgi:glutamate-1-semialdehyde 2,1-aminomutase
LPTPASTPISSPIDAYAAATPGSKHALERALRYLPSGLSRQTLMFSPHPFVARRGEGAYLEDIDGHRYLDFVNNHTSLIHGHAHRPTTEALVAATASSSAPGAPTELERVLAEEIVSRVSSIEWLRFTVTGTEAVLYALRAARAHTGRRRILKFEGGFHGAVDDVQVSITSEPMPSGSVSEGEPATDGLGVVDTLVAVYNDVDSVHTAFERYGTEIAAVVVEPFLGNGALVTASDEFLLAIRRASEASGALLILDEIQSCRLSYGAAQERLPIVPDLTTMGKTIGGGMPLALVGGRRDVMEAFDGLDPRVRQTGTFTAFPPSLVAGLAALRDWQPADVDRLNAMGADLREGLARALQAAGVEAQINGQGSMFNITLLDRPVTTYRDFMAGDRVGWDWLHKQLLLRGYFLIARGTGCLSTPMTTEQLRSFVQAVHDAALTLARHRVENRS